MADGTEFQIDIECRSAGVDTAAELVAKLGDRLTAACVASQAAAQALKAGEASYNAAAAAADRTSKTVEKLGVAAEAQKAKLAAAIADGGIFSAGAQKAADGLVKIEKAQADAAAKANAAKVALTAEAASLDKLKAAATAASKEEEKVSKTLDQAKKAAKAADDAAAAAAGSGNAKKTAKAFGDIGGPLSNLAQKFFNAKDTIEDFGETLGEGGPYAIAAAAAVAIVAGIGAITAAAVAGIAQITLWGISLADAARSNRILAEGITQSVSGGAALDKAISSLAGKVPQTRDELLSMADQLAKTGLKGAALADALEDAATKAAKAKFGPEWQKQMLGIEQQQKRLKGNLAGLFGGLNIEKLLEQLSTLVDLFDKNSASGRAIKVVFESLFQPIIDGAVAFIPKARTAFIQFEIMVMKAMIAIKPWGTTILYVVGAFAVLGAILLGVIAIAIAAVVFSVTMLAIGVALVVAAVIAFGAALYYIGQLCVSVGVAIGQGLVSAFNYLSEAFSGVVSFLQGIDLVSIGTQIIQGLANGISGGGTAVIDAITGVVGSAVGAAKKALGIASPSKVLEAQVGAQMGAGVAVGLEKSTDQVQGALEGAVTPSASALEGVGNTTAQTSAPSAGGGGSSSLNLAGATFNFYGVKDAEEAESGFGELITRLLEGDAAQLGAEVPG